MMRDLSLARDYISAARRCIKNIPETADVHDMLGRLSEELGTYTPNPGRVKTMQNIYYDNKTEAYRVEIERERKRYSKRFPVSRYRTINAAFEAAKEYRLEVIDALGG